MSNCCSHGTFLCFSLQSSHLNICYNHRDLHQRPFRPGTRQRLRHDHRALLLVGSLNSSNPEENFGGNQPLDGSISLSQLYPNSTIDLHVRIATNFHQCFCWLHPIEAYFTIFLVRTDTLLLPLF